MANSKSAMDETASSQNGFKSKLIAKDLVSLSAPAAPAPAKSKNHHSLAEQEQFIKQQLNLPDDEWGLENRVNMAHYLMETDQALINEKVRLFEVINSQLTPMNLVKFTQELIERSYAIGEMALRFSPSWCTDFIKVFMYDMGRSVDYGDSDYKHSFVLLLRWVVDAQERGDFIAISDLFNHEVPALLRSLIKFHQERIKATHKTSREQILQRRQQQRRQRLQGR